MNEDKARELAQQFGVRMCDENGETHGEELYCLGLDDIIDMAKALAQQTIEALEQNFNCAECGAGGGHALYCVACAEKFVGGYKENVPVHTSELLTQVSTDIQYAGNGTAGREADVRPTGFFFQADKRQSKQCKYGQEPKSCTSSPMDCQCAIDATFAQPEQEPVIGTKTWFEDGKVVTQHLTAKDIYKDPPQTNAYDNMLKAIDSMRPAARVIKDKPATWWLDEFEKVVRNLKENNT